MRKTKKNKFNFPKMEIGNMMMIKGGCCQEPPPPPPPPPTSNTFAVDWDKKDNKTGG